MRNSSHHCTQIHATVLFFSTRTKQEAEKEQSREMRVMAVGFRRTLTLLVSPKTMVLSFLLDCTRPKKLSYAWVWSTILPVRLHLLAALHDAACVMLGRPMRPQRYGPRGPSTALAVWCASWQCSRTCSTICRRATRSGSTPGWSSSLTTSSPTFTGAFASRSFGLTLCSVDTMGPPALQPSRRLARDVPVGLLRHPTTSSTRRCSSTCRDGCRVRGLLRRLH